MRIFAKCSLFHILFMIRYIHTLYLKFGKNYEKKVNKVITEIEPCREF